jgi:uncharacterized protein YfiM (DUF2279 family)
LRLRSADLNLQSAIPLAPYICMMSPFNIYGKCVRTCSLLALVLMLQLPSMAQADSTDEGVGVPIPLPFNFFSLRDSVTSADSLSKNQKNSRQWGVGILHAVAYGGSLVVLNQAWYKDYAKEPFHAFDDSREWLQVDKAGHAWSTYNLARASTSLWRWAGIPGKKAAWIGSLSSMTYLTTIEFMDAHSAKWGWSWADMGANVFGTGLYLGQELGWQEQRIQFKFSFHHNSYSDLQLHERANDLFGQSWAERMLKDYNAQTYWLSINPWSFNKKGHFPKWLNIAVGYGATGMYGGFENAWVDKNGTAITRFDQLRKRQFYLSPDIDLTRLPVKHKFWRTVLSVVNAFKFPAPALMLDSRGKFRAYAFYF